MILLHTVHNVILAQWLKLERLTIPTVGEEVGQLELLDIVGRAGHLSKQFRKF